VALGLLRSSFPDRRAREAALAKALALLHEAAAHASARLAAAAALATGGAGAGADAAGSSAAPPPPPPRCALLVSDRGGAEGEGPPLLFVYQRWLPLILALRVRPDGTGGAGGGGGGGGAGAGGYALALLPTDAGPRDASGAWRRRTALPSACVCGFSRVHTLTLFVGVRRLRGVLLAHQLRAGAGERARAAAMTAPRAQRRRQMATHEGG
jgi:hypothetical protein